MKQKIINTNENKEFFNNNSTIEKITMLEERIKVLNKICDEINPYEELNETTKEILRHFGIMEFSNPFYVTNTLVLLLEDSIEELHQLKPYTES